MASTTPLKKVASSRKQLNPLDLFDIRSELTEDEQMKAAQFVVEKLNQANGSVTLLVPLKGGSIMDVEGGAFWQSEWNRKCREILHDGLNGDVRYREVDAHINDNAFAEAAFEELMRLVLN